MSDSKRPFICQFLVGNYLGQIAWTLASARLIKATYVFPWGRNIKWWSHDRWQLLDKNYFYFFFGWICTFRGLLMKERTLQSPTNQFQEKKKPMSNIFQTIGFWLLESLLFNLYSFCKGMSVSTQNYTEQKICKVTWILWNYVWESLIHHWLVLFL